MNNYIEVATNYLLLSHNLSSQLLKIAIDYEKSKTALHGNELLQTVQKISVNAINEFSPLLRDKLASAARSLRNAIESRKSKESIPIPKKDLLLEILGDIKQNVDTLNSDTSLTSAIKNLSSQCKECIKLVENLSSPK